MRIGEYQTLRIERESPHGLYLADAEAEVLLPRNQCNSSMRFGESIKVFVYTDSEDRPVATTRTPYAVVGEFAMLEVVSMTRVGAFLDWGLDKDLFCPMKAQSPSMRVGNRILVRVFLDEASQRVTCTTKFTKFLRTNGEGLETGQKVKILIADFAPNMTVVIVDNQYKASLFQDEYVERLRIGDVRDGYIKSVRPEDHKIAVSFRPQGYQAIIGERGRLIAALRQNGGFLPISDQSSPEDILRQVGMSKGAFKKLVGSLYKERLIKIETRGIRLAD